MEEFHRDWEPGGWRLLIVGPTATWRLDWEDWEAIRDIVQNALDEAESYTWGSDAQGLWIEDPGRGLQVADFLLGPPKPKPPYARGKFGEGMKISALALLRLGYSVRVETVGRELWVVFLKVRINGEAEQLAALWRPSTRRVGTRFHIIGYRGTGFEERFAVNIPRQYILHKGPSPLHLPIRRYNWLIGEPFQGMIYARDIYLRDIDSPWSYNLWGFEMAPDRHAPKDEYELRRDLGRLWSTVTNVELLQTLLGMIASPPIERTFESDAVTFEYLGEEPVSKVPYVDIITQQAWAWQQAWRRRFGDKIIRTSADLDSTILHLGYGSQSLSYRVSPTLEKVITTDRQLVIGSQARLRGVKIIPDNQLTPPQLVHLNLARAIARLEFDPPAGVHAAIIPPASDRTRTAGMYQRSTREIFISLEQLDYARSAVDTLIHELAHHTSGAEDLTEKHSSEMTRLASLVVQRASQRWFDEELKEAHW